MKKKNLLCIGILTVLVLSLTACTGGVNYNTVEGTLYEGRGFTRDDILAMSRILEDNIIEGWYQEGITPDNFESYLIDQWEDSVFHVYQSGYRSWYSAIGDLTGSQGEASGDVSVEDVTYYVDGDGILNVEAQLKGASHDGTLVYQIDRNRIPLSIGVNVQRSFGEKLKNAGLNTLLGMGMAFFVLILISLVISLFALMSGNGGRRKRPAAGKTAVSKEKTEAIDNTMAQISKREDALQEQEIAAVITAAIAAYEADTGRKGGVVTRIARSTGEAQLPQMPEEVPYDGVFIRPVRKREKRNWKRAI